MGGKPRPSIRGAHLHIDGASGCAGDMFLGAMIDVGVPVGEIRRAVAALGDGLEIRATSVVRGGIAASDVAVLVGGAKIEEGPGHTVETQPTEVEDHGHHHHRRYRDIREQLNESALADPVRARALDIFDRLATVEAALHGTTVSEVAFHELGALDALGDVVGAAAAIEWLAPASVSAAPVSMGAGRVKTAHGLLPVPSPAALAVLCDAQAMIDVSSGRFELCTPTGAAILASIVTDWGHAPAMRPLSIGYGAGDLELADRPNVLRATIGDTLAAHRTDVSDRVVVLECNLDDISAEVGAYAAERLFAVGALDVWWTPITMKKGRAATTLSAIVSRHARAQALEVLLSETTTIGVRVREVDRVVLARELEVVSTRFGTVTMKVARSGGVVRNVAPEYEGCAELARASKVALKDVYAAAIAAFESRQVEGVR